MGNLILPLLLVALVLPMFLGRRRQQRMVQEAQTFQDSLTIGERIMTTSGLHATIVDLAEDTVELEIAPGVVTTWARIVVKERIVEADPDEDRYDAMHDGAAHDITEGEAVPAYDLTKHDAKDS